MLTASTRVTKQVSSCRMEAEFVEHVTLLIIDILTRQRIDCMIKSLFFIGMIWRFFILGTFWFEVSSSISSTGCLSPASVAARKTCTRTVLPLHRGCKEGRNTHQSCRDTRANPIPCDKPNFAL